MLFLEQQLKIMYVKILKVIKALLGLCTAVHIFLFSFVWLPQIDWSNIPVIPVISILTAALYWTSGQQHRVTGSLIRRQIG